MAYKGSFVPKLISVVTGAFLGLASLSGISTMLAAGNKQAWAGCLGLSVAAGFVYALDPKNRDVDPDVIAGQVTEKLTPIVEAVVANQPPTIASDLTVTTPGETRRMVSYDTPTEEEKPPRWGGEGPHIVNVPTPDVAPLRPQSPPEPPSAMVDQP